MTLEEQVIEAAKADKAGDKAWVKSLLGQAKRADIDTALKRAALTGRTKHVRLLLENGADIHSENDLALRWAAQHGYTKTVELLLDRGAPVSANENYALRWAAENGHTETITLLLSRGADVHANDDEALRRAAHNGHRKIAQTLLRHYSRKGLEAALNIEKFVPIPKELILAELKTRHDRAEAQNLRKAGPALEP